MLSVELPWAFLSKSVPQDYQKYCGTLSDHIFGQKVSSSQLRAAFEFFDIVTYWSCQTSFKFRQSTDVDHTFAINLIRL